MAREGIQADRWQREGDTKGGVQEDCHIEKRKNILNNNNNNNTLTGFLKQLILAVQKYFSNFQECVIFLAFLHGESLSNF